MTYPDICIDSTEVTEKQYQQFLDSKPSLESQSEPCKTMNSTFAPPPDADCPFAPQTEPNLPARTYLDWCDASAYCAWAGKHLCTSLEWQRACSKNGAQKYSWGNQFDPMACNMQGKDPVTPPNEVGTSPSCEGGFPGIYDMLGNVREWTDECLSADTCKAVGGDYTSVGNDCSSYLSVPRLAHFCQIGFRCCR